MTEAASLLAGPDPDAATRRAFHWADAEADDAPDAVLCLTQSTDRAEALERRWAEDRNPLRFTATTLDRFVSDCYERATGSLADTTLSKPERLRLVEAAIERFDGDDGPFVEIDQPSNDLVDQVQGLFSLLEYAGYATPDEMEHALRSAGAVGDDALDPDLFASFRSTEVSDSDGALDSQAAIIPELYAKYQSLREELHPDWKTVNSEQYLALLDGDQLLDAVPSSVDAVVLDGLTRLAPAERETIARIGRNLPTVAVLSLVHDSMGGNGLDFGVQQELTVYQAIGFQLDYEAPEPVDDRRLDAVRSLHVASRDPPSYAPSDVGIEWLEPSTEREEVRTVARRIRGLLTRDNVEPSDVGVVVTDRTTYRGILAETLGGYDVPFTFTNDIGIEQTLVGDAVEGLLDLADGETHVTALRSLCSNALVSLEAFGVDPAAVRRVNESVDGDSIEALLDELEDDGATTTAVGIEELIDRVDPDGASLVGYVMELEDLLEDLTVGEAVEEHGAPSTATGSHRPAYERSAWESVEGVLDSLEDVAPHVSDEEPVGRVRRALRAELVSGPSQCDGYVRVLPMAEAEMASFEHTFVLGLTSGYFPTEQDTMAFFGAVNDADEEFSRAHTGRRARYILGTLLTGSGQVVLSTPRHSVDGVEHVPAPVVTELRRYVDGPTDGDGTGRSVGPTDGSPDGAPSVAPTVTSEDVQRRYADWAGPQSFESVDEPVVALDGADGLTDDGRTFAEMGLTTAWRRAQPHHTAHDGHIGDLLEEIYPSSDREPYSPSALENYARCPFVYLATNVLGFEEDYGEKNEVSRADRGNFIHEVLADLYRGLREEAHSPVALTEFDREYLESELLSKSLACVDELGSIETPFARRTITRILAGLGSPSENPYYGPSHDGADGLFVRFLDAELEAADGAHARPTYFEGAIGIDYLDDVELLADEPVTVDTPDGPVDVSGIADRIDVVPDGASPHLPDGVRGIYVRDYKTGNTPARADVTDGAKLQLPLYGLALEKILEEETGIPHETIGGSYYRLKSPTDIDPTAGQVTSRSAVGSDDGLPLVTPTGQTWRLPFDDVEQHRRFVREVTSSRLGRIASAIDDGAFHTTLLSADHAGCEDCTFRNSCDVRHHLRQDQLDKIDDAEHYVSEGAREEELDLEAYGTGGDD